MISAMRQLARKAAFVALAVSASAIAPTTAPAQQYPERGVTLIVPYGAGGGTDITARLLAKDLEAVMGKPVTVENRAGGGGWLGWSALAAAAPDGYILGYLNVPSMYAGYLDPKVGRKESLDSFTPLMNHALDYNIWGVKADSPFKGVKDVIDAAKAAPEKITVTAYGAGGDDHLAILGIEAGTAPSSRWCTAAARQRPRPRFWGAT
jgi:tripartite-type tricarboxylate transporter receptor subunit TctC